MNAPEPMTFERFSDLRLDLSEKVVALVKGHPSKEYAFIAFTVLAEHAAILAKALYQDDGFDQWVNAFHVAELAQSMVTEQKERVQ